MDGPRDALDRSHPGSALDRVPPIALVLGGMATVQIGAAVAKSLFASIGPGGTVFLRVGFAAIVLILIWRPWAGRGRASVRHVASRRDWLAVLAFGLVLGSMNLVFYSSIERIPLGVAVTVEFVGPLAVAVAGSRRLLDLVWVALAAVGIVLLGPLPAGGALELDPLGLALALLAGGFWAAYILLAARVGRAVPGMGGLALAMAVAGVALLPVGVLGPGPTLLDPRLLLAGLGVALLSSVVPYSLELAALRRLPTGTFGVLMSLEPAIASLAGLLLLHESLTVRTVLALALVTVASIGATRSAPSSGHTAEAVP
jgi:inner membrane transporter RhtA